jgi:hypothetical protein
MKSEAMFRLLTQGQRLSRVSTSPCCPTTVRGTGLFLRQSLVRFRNDDSLPGQRRLQPVALWELGTTASVYEYCVGSVAR